MGFVSPLRYPGGKTRIASAIVSMIPKEEKVLCSPFFGGGSVEIIASHRMKVYGYDLFKPLVAFWKAAISEPEKLANEVEKFYPLSKNDFYTLQKQISTETDQFTKAAFFYIINRASYSGTTLSGGMSPNHPRFNKSAIDRLYNFKSGDLTVECLDFCESIDEHKDDFLYLDPPYCISNFLYGNKGDLHKDFPHDILFEKLKERDRWILSYNDSEIIRDLYHGFQIIELSWKYGMSRNKNSKEIVVLSKELEGLVNK
jgi:DNA adenine methylase